VVSFTPDMNVLDSTWAIKCKIYPDGNIRKIKARFCFRGNQQINGTDYFDTLFQWSHGLQFEIYLCFW